MNNFSSNIEPSPEYLQGLNPPQLAAVKHFLGPILVLAGAGSGKTRVLTRRVVNLVLGHDISPQNILAVTFTNKATEEMRQRLQQQLGERGRQLWVATFHSSALRILRRHAPLLNFTHDFAIYDEDDSRGVLKAVIKELSLDEKRYTPAIFSRVIDRAKNNFLFPNDLASLAKDREAQTHAEVYDRYQRALLKANAMDFGDLLVNVLILFEKNADILRAYQEALHFILVDEFQDTNKVQYRFLKLLSARHRNLLVVGDDDQSIYAFRGADLSNILNFERDFPETKVVKLEQNYRSTATILEASHAVIEKNKERKAKKLWTSSAAGSKIQTYVGYDESAEAAFVAREIKYQSESGFGFKDIAIFYRTNAQSRALEEALMRAKIPYRIYGGLKFYERKEIKDILGFIKIALNQADNQSFMRVVNTPPRGIGAQSIQSLSIRAQQESISLFAAAQRAVSEGDASKGLVQFVQLVLDIEKFSKTLRLSALINFVVTASEYEIRLQALKDPSSQSRIENLRELEAIGRSMESDADTPSEVVRQFLDRVSLSSSAELPVEETKEQLAETKPNVVCLMTLHLAKGLEFPLVFLTGLEEGLLPHYRSIDDPNGIAEERRLCYVGLTRAMRRLYLTRATTRGLFSSGEGFGVSGFYRAPSRFAKDLPAKCLEHLSEDFCSGTVTIESSNQDFEDESDDQDLYSGSKNRNVYGESSKNLRYAGPGARTASRSQNSDRFTLLKNADSLLSNESSQKRKKIEQPLTGLVPALPTQVQPGSRVIHPYLGKGEVQQIEGDPSGATENIKVCVKFDQHPIAKKLIWKFANLSLIE